MADDGVAHVLLLADGGKRQVTATFSGSKSLSVRPGELLSTTRDRKVFPLEGVEDGARIAESYVRAYFSCGQKLNDGEAVERALTHHSRGRHLFYHPLVAGSLIVMKDHFGSGAAVIDRSALRVDSPQCPAAVESASWAADGSRVAVISRIVDIKPDKAVGPNSLSLHGPRSAHEHFRVDGSASWRKVATESGFEVEDILLPVGTSSLWAIYSRSSRPWLSPKFWGALLVGHPYSKNTVKVAYLTSAQTLAASEILVERSPDASAYFLNTATSE